MGQRSILTPVIEIGNLEVNAPAVMYNLYSEPNRINAIDYSVTCGLATADGCSSKNCSAPTGIIFLVQDIPVYRPASLITHPVKLDDGSVVAVATTVHNWDTVLSSSINEQVSGLTIVLAYGTQKYYTFTVEEGAVTFVQEGDHHDPKYDDRRYSFLTTSYGGPERFYVHLYPSDTWVSLYENELPAVVCGVTVGILVLTSLIFFFYDFLMNRASLEKDLILNTKRQFVRYISHEIRTPLNIVQLGFKLLYSEMFTLSATLQSQLPSQSQSQSQLENNPQRVELSESFKDWLGLVTDISDSADVAISVLNDLINYDKLHMGTLQLEIEPLFIWDIIAPAVHPFLIQARHGGVKLVTDYEDHRDSASAEEKKLMRNHIVFGDSGKLCQVIRNLVSNALKFTPSGGEVTISGESSH